MTQDSQRAAAGSTAPESRTVGDSTDSMERRASPTRRTVLWSAVVQIDDQAIECVVVNISPDGAMIQLSSDIFCDNSILLRNTRLGTLLAKAVWQDGRQVGLEFREDRVELARQLESLLA